MRRGMLVMVALLFLAENSVAAELGDSTWKRKDDPIVAMIDSMMTMKFLQSNHYALNTQNKYNFPTDSIPRYPESVYRQRIKRMDSKTPMEFVLNDKVLGYIELYAIRYRKYTQIIMGMTSTYFPLFEQTLDKHGVPLELKHLPIVESALNPKAKSPAGAMGLWQFMLPTGKLFGLEVNSMIDERCDPIKSTEAAAKYLKYLHSLYNDWNMALAAYNAGPGTVNNAIRRSGGKTTYWEIYSFLPRETQGYVPAFIAVNYVFSHALEHNMYPMEPKMRYFEYDTVVLKKELDMAVVADVIGISLEELKFLNPVYKTSVIPNIEGKKSYIYLPKDKVGDFLVNEDTLYNFKGNVNPEGLASEKVHYVKSGEYLSTIADKYHVSVADLKKWNNLGNNSLVKGQKLIIKSSESTPVNNNTASTNVNTTKSTNTTTNTNTKVVAGSKVHTVKSGDTLWDIAVKYGCKVDDIKKLNNLNGNGLQAGQKLKIPAQGNG